MNDLISRQAALDVIAETDITNGTEPVFTGKQVQALLRDLPTVTPKQRWIPISERLPLLRGSYKISDDVLITNGYENDMGYLVKRKGQIFWHYYGSDIEVGINDEDNDATAWMPLPEPYKAESEDKE